MEPKEGPPIRIGFPVKLNWQQLVWVVDEPIRRGQPIQPRILKQSWIERKNGQQPLSIDELKEVAYEARHYLTPGTVLDVRRDQRAPMVHRNQELTLI